MASEPNEIARQAWDTSADAWDSKIGEDGNRFTRALVWPVINRLLQPHAGQKVVEIACGNGVIARQIAKTGATVVASDFSEVFIKRARSRWTGGLITYEVVDATNKSELLQLGSEFDAGVVSMALFDIADIRPIFSAMAQLLRPGAPFVATVIHPCFNNLGMELCENRDNEPHHYIKVWHYLQSESDLNAGILAQPMANPVFHRPLMELLRPAFESGFVIDSLEEPSFETEDSYPSRLRWDGRFSEIPPILAIRFRLP